MNFIDFINESKNTSRVTKITFEVLKILFGVFEITSGETQEINRTDPRIPYFLFHF